MGISHWIAEAADIPELEHIIYFILKIVMTFFSVFIANFFVRISKKVIYKGFSKFSIERRSDTAASLMASMIKYIIYFIVFCNVLVMWGINITSILALGGAVSVAVGLGAQDIVKDMMAGLFIITENQFGVGDIVELNGFSGTVESIGIRTTRIRNADGNVHIVPNGQISIVTNMSKGFNRAIVDIAVAYDENIDRVFGVLKDEFEIIFNSRLIEGIIDVPQVWGIHELAESGVVIRVAADSEIGENWRIERELRKFILKRFDKEKIEIPFTQIVVHSKED
ncbi:MAG: mechanosensitive ion channel family protein [Clostridia bacterium]|nr:mechanosensitive ion channel family protein [Clostridia bacterium]